MSEPDASLPARVPLAEALRVWLRIGLLGFGGPAGQIALMHRELVERRRWIDETRYLHALQLCMLLPGPEAQQLATYVGFLMHGFRGAIAAGVLFVLPGCLLITGLATAYAELGHLPAIAGLFSAVGAAVIALVLEALVRIGKRALDGRASYAIAAASFVGLHFFGIPFPLLILGAGLLGTTMAGGGSGGAPAGPSDARPSVIEAMELRGELAHVRPSSARAARTLVVCLLLWAAPPLACALWLGCDAVVVREGLFFSQAAMVTFGGAYAVLGWVAERAVSVERWLSPTAMLDGLGLAETTPGPLVLVLTFVGFLGAYNRPGPLAPLPSGLLGAFVTTWVTFVPSFLYVLVLAPYVESLRANVRLRGALAAITAAVLGVILHLSIFFFVHVLFREVRVERLGPLRWYAPTLASFAAWKLVVTGVACLFVFRAPLLRALRPLPKPAK